MKMNIILITDDRLKVTLTEQDLNGYGIRIEDIDYGNTETKRVFWTILDKAKNETGFDAAQSRIFIQIYPDTQGGCEMYVSRIGEKKNAENRERVRCNVGSRARKKPAEQVYRFDTLELLITACKLLIQKGFKGRSTAYVATQNGDGECYLLLKADAEWKACLAEYGESCGDKYAKWSVAEHCKTICEKNAIEILGRL